MKGFSLLELLIVVALTAVLSLLAVPLGLDFYDSFSLDSFSSELLFDLRDVQSRAIHQEGDSDYGLKINLDNYVLFKGPSFSERDASFDKIVDTSSFAVSGIEEVVFSKLSGLPSVSGTIDIASDLKSSAITINSAGGIF